MAGVPLLARDAAQTAGPLGGLEMHPHHLNQREPP